MALSHRLRRTHLARPTPMSAVEAQQLLASHQPSEAIELCKRGLIYYPEHVTGYVVLSQAYLDLGERERAVNVLRDGHRRTGATRLDQLRAEVASESIGTEQTELTHERQTNGTATRDSRRTRAWRRPLRSDRRSDVLHVESDEPIRTDLWKRLEELDSPEEDDLTEDTDRSLRDGVWVRTSDMPLDESITEEEVELKDDPIMEIEEYPSWSEEQSAEFEEEAVDSDEGTLSGEDTVGEAPSDRTPVESEIEIDITEDSVWVVEAEAWQVPEIRREEAIAEPSPIGDEPEQMSERADEQPGTEEPAVEVMEESTHDSTPQSILPELEAITRPVMAPSVEEFDSTAHPHSPHGTPASAASEPSRHLSLAIHAGKNIARLRSSNLRLIPGLEFAPLRSGESSQRQTIAPLIHEPLPELDLPERPGLRSDIASRISIPVPGDLPLEESSSGVEEEWEMATDRYMDDLPIRTQGILPASHIMPTTAEKPHSQPAPKPRRETAFDTSRLHVEIAAKDNDDLSPLEELARRLEHARIPVVEEEEVPTVFEPSIVSETLANILVTQGKYAEALKAFQTLARMKPDRYEHLQYRIMEMKWRINHPGKEWPPGEDVGEF